MSLLSRLLGDRSDRLAYQPLYKETVAIGRDPAWYRAGQVPDTVSGRFDVIAAVFTLLLLRLEREDTAEARTATVLLTELFADDMDGSLRQIGIGDLVMTMMQQLGGSPFQVQRPEDHFYASTTGSPLDCPQPDLGLLPGPRTEWNPSDAL